jgi:hypothetical protein
MTQNQTRQLFSDLYTPLLPEHRFISPLHGVIWCHNEIAEKYYRFLGVGHPLGQVAHSLFYRTDLVEFDVSKEVNQPFSWFSTSTIAHLVASLSNASFEEADVDTLFERLQNEETFSYTVDQQHQLSARIRQLCDCVLQQFELTKTLIADGESETLRLAGQIKLQEKVLNQILQQAENAAKDTQEALKQLRSGIVALKAGKKVLGKSREENRETQLQAINAEITDLEARLVANQWVAVRQADMLPAWEAAQSALACLREEKEAALMHTQALTENFTEHTIEHLHGSGFSTEFIEQHLPFNKFHRYLPRRVHDYVNIHCADRDNLLCDLHKLCRLLVTACHDHYHDVIHLINAALWLKCKGDLGKLSDYSLQLHELCPKLFADSVNDDSYFPYLCYEFYDREVYGRYFPPLCITKTCRPTPDSEVSFSDCGESSLRNFINVLIKNQHSARLDASVLERSGLAVDPRVIAFYKRNHSLETVKSLEVHSQWAEITSYLNSQDSRIKYLTPGKDAYCELAAGGGNMMHVLQALFGEAEIPAICRKIALASGIDIRCDLSEFHPERNDLEDFTNFVRIEFEGKYVFYWYFLKQHFRCASADLFSEEENYLQQALSELISALQQQQLDHIQFRSLLSFLLKEKPVAMVKNLFDSLNATGAGDEMTFLMLGKLNSVDSMFDYCMQMLDIPGLAHSHKTSDSVTAIIKGISPHPVIFEQRKMLIAKIREVNVTSLKELADQWEIASLEKV